MSSKPSAPHEEFRMMCFHCDEYFPDSYVRWHFARRKPADKCKGESVLTCKACGLMTPVRFQFDEKGTV